MVFTNLQPFSPAKPRWGYGMEEWKGDQLELYSLEIKLLNEESDRCFLVEKNTRLEMF